MALVVLFVSMGWDVRFHYCTEAHQLSGRIGVTAAESCLHCLDHEDAHDGLTVAQADVIHYESKCCCNDFDSKIQFTDNFVFSTEKHLNIHFQPFAFAKFDLLNLPLRANQSVSWLDLRKIPHLPIGKLRLVFFSQLKLNPLVF